MNNTKYSLQNNNVMQFVILTVKDESNLSIIFSFKWDCTKAWVNFLLGEKLSSLPKCSDNRD